MADDEAKKAKQAEIDRKRAEVRRRMEEASKAKKAKKGFMTPERKKKLRLLLRKKAAEELKKEQERKAAERRRIIEERCGRPKNLEDSNEASIKKICQEYHTRIASLEDKKFDIEYIVKKKDFEIADLNSQVNDLRGKFVKPTLKKVSKYENKFAKLQKKAAEFNFRNQLKVVKKKEFALEDEDKEKKTIVDFKKGDEKKSGEEKKEDGEEEDTPPAVGELSDNPEGAEPLDGAETRVTENGEPVEGEEQPVAVGEEAIPSSGGEGDVEMKVKPEGVTEEEQPPLLQEPEPEPVVLGPYIEPEDTPALIEDMQQYLQLLKQASVELPPEGDDAEPKPVESTEGEVNLNSDATAQLEGEATSNEVNSDVTNELSPPVASEAEVPVEEVAAIEPQTTDPEPIPEVDQETPETQ